MTEDSASDGGAATHAMPESKRGSVPRTTTAVAKAEALQTSDATANDPLSVATKELQLDLPNENSFWEQMRITSSVTALRSVVDLALLPRTLHSEKHLFKITIDTGRTGSCRLCVYVPKQLKAPERKRGAVMHLHGGGWTIERPESEMALSRYLADHVESVVVAPDYRKAPEYPYPHALEQIYQVASWIASGGLHETLLSHTQAPNASLLAENLDSSRIGLVGASAGSNLAAALSTLAISRPLPAGAKIAAQGLLYPALNLAVPYADKLARVDPARVLPPWMSKLFLTSYLPPPRRASDPLVSPALAPDTVAAALPPTMILTAAYDYLAHEADEYAERLRGLGVRVGHRRFEDVGHAFDGIPTRDRKQRLLNDKARDEAWGMISAVMKEVLY